MAILTLIKAAEEAAEEDKRRALAKAKDYVGKAESAAARAADDIVAQARAAAREKVAAATRISEEKFRELLLEREAQNFLLWNKVRARLEDAADYIVEKVTLR